MAEVGLPVDERYAPPARVTQGALVTSMAQYEALYRRSVDDRDAFWSEMANALRKRGVGRGDRVPIYMGMVPELAAAMLACARIGAIHSVIFGGFSPRSIRDRIDDSTCKAIITQDEGRRGGRGVPLKANVDEALHDPGHSIEFTIVYRHTGNPVDMQAGRDLWWH